MATKDYTGLRAMAERQIAKWGTTGAIRRDTTSAPTDPFDPSTGTETVTDHTCKFVKDNYTLRERENSSIGATDKRVWLSTEGLSIEPATSDKLVVGGVAHTIAWIEPTEPGDTVVVRQMRVVF